MSSPVIPVQVLILKQNADSDISEMLPNFQFDVQGHRLSVFCQPALGSLSQKLEALIKAKQQETKDSKESKSGDEMASLLKATPGHSRYDLKGIFKQILEMPEAAASAVALMTKLSLEDKNKAQQLLEQLDQEGSFNDSPENLIKGLSLREVNFLLRLIDPQSDLHDIIISRNPKVSQMENIIQKITNQKGDLSLIKSQLESRKKELVSKEQ